MALIYAGGLASTDFTDGYSSSGYQPHNYVYGGHIEIPSSGTVTQLGAYCCSENGSSVQWKIGLYTSSGVLVAQSTISATTSQSFAWLASGAISGTVSAGTYYVLVSASTQWGMYRSDNSQAGSYADGAYAASMLSTVSTAGFGAESGQLYGVRLDFTAGGGGATSLVPSATAARLHAILLPNF